MSSPLPLAEPLPDHAPAVIIGGGIMGCSTLYHLAKLGHSGALLLERDRLTSGTTWHSAAQVRQLRSTRNLTELIRYSAELYAALEAETGQATGWLRTGSLSLATNADRLTHIRRQAALARAYGIEAQEVDAREVQRLWPLANTQDVVGAVYAPDDGRVNPSDLCLALAKGARAAGAIIREHTTVTDFVIENRRIAGVVTPSGTVRCDAAVICAGLWSRDLALKAGVDAPLLPCEHYYLLTRPLDGVDGHLPTLSDHDGHLYIRDDVGGLLVGCFEPQAEPVLPQSLGEDFAFSLLPEDWDHFEPMMENALHRIPALEHAQVRTLLNGPESFTPDGSFLLGETGTVDGLYLCCGLNSVGIATGGGAGRAIASWVADRAPPMDLGEVDPRRFAPVENAIEALVARAPEVLSRHYEIAYPGREWATARDLALSPLHARHVADQARFGQRHGWERPLYYGGPADPQLTFARPPWHETVAREIAAAHGAAALFDQSSFGKILVRGVDAEAFLQRLCANDMARAPGRVIYTALLSDSGHFVSDLTALRLTDDAYLLQTGTASAERDLAWLRRHVRPGERVELAERTRDLALVALCGPHSPAILRAVFGDDLETLGYFHHLETDFAGTPVRAARVSYVGERGVELTVDARRAVALWDALCEAGADLGLRPAGAYAQTAMRIEKRYLAFGHDLAGDDTPLEAGLAFAVKLDGEQEFLGRTALLRQRQQGLSRRLVTVLIPAPDVWPIGNEPVYDAAGLLGQLTSAAYGHRVGHAVALGYMRCTGDPGELDGRDVALDMAGQRIPATLRLAAAFDPQGTRLRAQHAIDATPSTPY